MTISITDDRSYDRDFTCGELQTTKRYGYGTYEVRMRVPKTQGIVSAFHNYSHNSSNQGIHLTFPGNRSEMVLTNFVVGASTRNDQNVERWLAPNEMHDYAIEWSPGSLRWYVDGDLVREVIGNGAVNLPSEPSKLHLHIWNAAIPDWLGSFTYPGTPVTLEVDWVAFTAQGEKCQFKGSILCGRGATLPSKVSMNSTTR